MQVPFLGAIPMEPEFMEAEDKGQHYIINSPESTSSKALRSIIDKVLTTVG